MRKWWQRLTFRVWLWRARKDLCQGCGNPKNVGLHGMSEYGGCV